MINSPQEQQQKPQRVQRQAQIDHEANDNPFDMWLSTDTNGGIEENPDSGSNMNLNIPDSYTDQYVIPAQTKTI